MTLTYDRTAIARNTVSKPMRAIIDFFPNLAGKKILHYGCGRAVHDTLALRHIPSDVTDYDPNSPYPNVSNRALLLDNYNVAISVYVFNTLPPDERQRAWQQMIECSSIAIWAVRADKIAGEPYEDGVITKANTFQKSYTVESAQEEWPQATILHSNSSFITLWE